MLCSTLTPGNPDRLVSAADYYDSGCVPILTLLLLWTTRATARARFIVKFKNNPHAPEPLE